MVPGKDFDAVITMSDWHSYAVIEELQRRNYRVPVDVAVIGYNNHIESIACNPPLTTVSLNQHDIAKKAVKLLQEGPIPGRFYSV